MPRLGDYGVRELTPKRLARFREELERDGVGAATVVKAMRDRPVDHLVRDQRGTGRVQRRRVGAKAALRAEARTAHLPARRRRADPRASSASSETERSYPCSPTRARDPKRSSSASSGTTSANGRFATATRSVIAMRFTPLLTPLAEDLREWFVASGRPERDDSRVPSARRRLLGPRRLAKLAQPRLEGRAGSIRQRPSTQSRGRPVSLPPARGRGTCDRATSRCASTRGCRSRPSRRRSGTSIQMIEQHYAGVIENWDGRRVPAERQIRAARRTSGRKMDARP